MTDNETNGNMRLTTRSFLTALGVIFALMVGAYVLTFLIPGGAYERDGRQIVAGAAFSAVEGGIPFWKWLLSPFLVLGGEGGGTLLAVIAFLLVIGGVFSCLGECRLMAYLLSDITHRFGGMRYRLMAVVVFFFMALGSLIGSFEECVPLVPIVVALAVNLGWDALTGFAMSLLAVGCGFAAGVFNPFTVGVAQGLSGLPMFSGAWLRAVAFVLIYTLLMVFLITHAKRVERPLSEVRGVPFTRDAKLHRALWAFGGILGAGILIVLCSAFVPALQDLTMVIVAAAFLLAGVVSSFLAGMRGGRFFACFGSGLAGMLPPVLMILMASSIQFTLEEAHVLDTVLHAAVGVTEHLPRFAVILFVYLIVLGMNFFIASGSAKAFMLMPLIVPLAELSGISPQLCVLAYAFGDGFSNVFYPTNPALLIALGVAGIGYGEWAKHSLKFQLANLLLTSLILCFGLAVGY